MENLRCWLFLLILFLYVVSPVTGVVLGMVYVHDWVAGHEDFLLQDFVLVTVAALAGGMIAAPILLTAVFLALSLVLLPAALAVAVVLVPVWVVVRVLSVAGSLARDAAASLAAALVFRGCLYRGHRHEKTIVWAVPYRSGRGRETAARS
jgi:hypothetical protein